MKKSLSFLVVIFCSSATFAAVNVQSYGATGNGITNDAPAIQAAMDAACNNVPEYMYPSVYVPAGTYLLNSTLVPKCALQIFGYNGHTTSSFHYQNFLNSGHTPPTPTSILKSAGYAFQTAYVLELNILGITGPSNTTSSARAVDIIGNTAVVGSAVYNVAPTYYLAPFAFNDVVINNFAYGINATTGTAISLIDIQDSTINTNAYAYARGVNVQNVGELHVLKSIISGSLAGSTRSENAINMRNVQYADILHNTFRNFLWGAAVKYDTTSLANCAIFPPHYIDYKKPNDGKFSIQVSFNDFDNVASAFNVYSWCGAVVRQIDFVANYVSNTTDTYIPNYAAFLVQSGAQSTIESVYSGDTTGLGLFGNHFSSLSMSAIALTDTSGGPIAPGTSAWPGYINFFQSSNDVINGFSNAYPNSLASVTSNGTPAYMPSATITHISITGWTPIMNLTSFGSVTINP